MRSVSALTSVLSGGSTPVGIECDFEGDHAGISLLQSVQLALALSHNRHMSSLTVRSCSSEILHVMCEAMKYNTMLRSCKIDLQATQVSDETGAAMAEALKQNTSLVLQHQLVLWHKRQ